MTTKQKVLKAVKSLPEDASYEDAMERLLFLAKIEKGILRRLLKILSPSFSFQAVDRLAVFAASGRVVPELGDPSVRELILGNYRLVYHAARLLDPSRLLKNQ